MKLSEIAKTSLTETAADEKFLHKVADKVINYLESIRDELTPEPFNPATFDPNKQKVTLYRKNFDRSVNATYFGTVAEITKMTSDDPDLEKMLSVKFYLSDALQPNDMAAFKWPPYGQDDIGSVHLNYDKWLQYKDNLPKLSSFVAHELRHCLDYIKSNSWAMRSRKKTEKFKSNRPSKYFSGNYYERKGEINARFTQAIKRIDNSLSGISNVDNNTILKIIKQAFDDELLTPQMFKYGKNDPAYRQLFKRAFDYISKEIQ